MHLVSMYVGSNQFHAATSDIVAQPANFFNIIGTQGIGYAFAPSFFLAGAAKAFAAQTSSPFLDFSKLAYIMTGGEAIKTTTIEAVDKILVRYGAHPDSIRIAYGLSEVSFQEPKVCVILTEVDLLSNILQHPCTIVRRAARQRLCISGSPSYRRCATTRRG